MSRVNEDTKVINKSNELQEMVFQLSCLLGADDLGQLSHHMDMAIMVLKKVERRGEDRRK